MASIPGLPPWLNWTGGAAILAVIAAGWGHVRAFFDRLTLIMFDRANLTSQSALAAMAFGWKLGYRSPLTTKMFGGEQLYVNAHHRYQVVGFETLGSQPRIIWYKGRPLTLSVNGKSSTQDIGGMTFDGPNVTLTTLRGTVDLKQFVIEAVAHYNKIAHPDEGTTTKRFCIRRCSGFSSSVEPTDKEKGGVMAKTTLERLMTTGVVMPVTCSIEGIGMSIAKGKDTFSGYAMNDNVRVAVKEAKRWVTNAEWFRSRNVPWRRGWLLYGPPGTGKSSLARLIGMDLDLPICVFDLTTHTNESFYKSWQEMMGSTPCIALIEDIDTAFHGRDNVSTGWRSQEMSDMKAKISDVKKHAKSAESFANDSMRMFGTQQPSFNALTFDCLLNCISGVTPAEGVFTIVTTNRVELLDPALGTPIAGSDSTSRPGRLDRAIYLGMLDEAGRRQLAGFILRDFPDLIEPLVKESADMTPAQFQDKCVRLAETAFWANEEVSVPSVVIEAKHMRLPDNHDFGGIDADPTDFRSKQPALTAAARHEPDYY